MMSLRALVMSLLTLISVSAFSQPVETGIALHVECTTGETCISLQIPNGSLFSFRTQPDLVFFQQNVTSAKLNATVPSRPDLNLKLSTQTATELTRLTQDNLGKRIAFVVRGEAIASSTLSEPLRGETLVIALGQIDEARRSDIWRRLPWLGTKVASASEQSSIVESSRVWRSYGIVGLAALSVLLSFYFFRRKKA